VQVGNDASIGTVGAGWTILEAAADYGAGLLCAEALGAMDALFGATLDYLKTRQQFGAPIGKFQALQHRMADMYIHLEQARSMALLAAVRLRSREAGDGERRQRRRSSAAKYRVGQAARFVGQQAVQLHGGMGVTDELPAAHYFKRLSHDRADPGRPRPPPGALHRAAGLLRRRRQHEGSNGISRISSWARTSTSVPAPSAKRRSSPSPAQFDPQPFHVDRDAAAASIYGGVIASGWHTCSMMMRMVVDGLMAKLGQHGLARPGRRALAAPVRAGDTLNVHYQTVQVKASNSKPDRGVVWSKWVAINQHGETVCTVEGMGMFGRRPRAEHGHG
jgi:acyl dehydratase